MEGGGSGDVEYDNVYDVIKGKKAEAVKAKGKSTDSKVDVINS